MTRGTVTSVPAVAAILTLAGCGYVGEPLPPALNIPVAIAGLTAAQRAGQVVIRFTIPSLTTEQLPLDVVEEVELRVGVNRAEPFDINTWAASARRVGVAKLVPGEVIASTLSTEWTGSEIVVGARMRGGKGRWSQWSNLVSLPIVEPAPTPSAVKAESIPAGVKISWTAPAGLKFRVLRGESVLAETATNDYADATAEFGKEYVYQVIALRGAAESEPAPAVTITPLDTFAPATPAGLTLIAGTRSIELAWERSTESDFKSYRVYRAEGDGAFAVIAAEIEGPSYSDRTAESGKRYRYSLTASDLSGNESPRAAPVSIITP